MATESGVSDRPMQLVNLRVLPEVRERILALAERRGSSISHVVREAVMLHLELLERQDRERLGGQ